MNLDTVAIAPGVFIKVERNAGAAQGPSIATLETGRNFDMAQIVIEQLRTNIKKILIDNEIAAGGRLGALADRVPGAQAGFLRRHRRGLWPDADRMGDGDRPARARYPVRSGDRADRGRRHRPAAHPRQVTSPIASVQKLKDTKAVLDWIAALLQAGGPQLVALTVKLEDLGDYFGDRMGVPSVLRRSPEERKAMQQQIAQIAAAQQMAQQQPANSNAGAQAA
ncbi:MAG: hypothetical protein WDM81_13885 [Rhizomicrobium sp.]